MRSLHLNLLLSQLVTGEVFVDLAALLSALLGLGVAAASPKRAILLSPKMSQMPQNKTVERQAAVGDTDAYKTESSVILCNINHPGTLLKTIGLIGGMSWESTVTYYRLINESIKERLGGLHSAKLVLYSVDFHEVERFQHAGDWLAAGELLSGAARSLQSAGADFLVLCTNTMHKVAPAIEAAVDIPLFHIADPTAHAIRQAGFETVGLIGTRFTMEQDFYRERLQQRHGLQVLIPTLQDRELVHRIIYNELCLGKIIPGSLAVYQTVIAELAARGAQAIILGCTEISLLVSQQDSGIPLFDTTSIHARKAAQSALSDN